MKSPRHPDVKAGVDDGYGGRAYDLEPPAGADGDHPQPLPAEGVHAGDGECSSGKVGKFRQFLSIS